MRNPKLEAQPAPRQHKPPPSFEKRLHPRLELGLRCWIGDERHTLYLRLHDLSRGGLSVRAPVPFAQSASIEVGLELPGGVRLRAIGEVVWVRSTDSTENGPRMGARFLQILEGADELDQVLGNA